MIEGSMEFFSVNMAVLEKWTKISGFMAIVGLGLCLYGSILMWKLKKQGYYFYLIGEILPIIIGIIMMSMMTWPQSGGFVALSMKIGYYVSIGLGLLFIGLYSLNLKHLK